MKRVINYACPTNNIICMQNVYRGKSGVNKSKCKSAKCVGGDQGQTWGTIGGCRCFGPQKGAACITDYGGISGNGVCVIHDNPAHWARAKYEVGENQFATAVSTTITEDGICPSKDTACMMFLVSGWPDALGATTLQFSSICPS